MVDYKHGAYGRIQTAGSRVASNSQSAVVYVGTAPVQTVEGGADHVNKPVVVNNIAEARALLGYSEDWASYTLCEAMHAHLENGGIGPLVLINVLDPATHKASAKTTKTLTPKNGQIVITDAESIWMDSVSVKTGGDESATEKVKGTDYAIAYNYAKKQIVIQELSTGALGSAALTITYDTVTPSSVTAAAVIGESDGNGRNTGIWAIKNVYQKTGYIPSYLAVPGFSGDPSVHSTMIQASSKINGHWDAYVFADLPIVHNNTAITLDSAAAWKEANGYNNENETVYFPLAKGIDGQIYHLSVLAAANFQKLLLEQDGIPWRTASNTECTLIENLWLGEAYKDRVYDDGIINNKLNRHGIASAAYVGGRWAIWGCHSADFDEDNGDNINVSETNRMMLYYISNDFQHRRTADVDKPMSVNDMQTVIAEEQTRLDALITIGALIYGEVHANATADARSDMMQGDYSFVFNVTTTPLAKSLTAIVNWTDDGYVTWFGLAD